VLTVEGAKEEINYPGLFRKVDTAIKKPLTIFWQGDLHGYVPSSVELGLKKLDVISYKYNDGIDLTFKN